MASANAPKFVFASDSFKGTLSSHETAVLLGRAAEHHFPGCVCVEVPMADGGEGTSVAVASACGGEMVTARAHDPLGREISATYAVLPGGRAVIETAAASGLPLLSSGERNPLLASTYGTGELVLDALSRGCRDVTVALGGSATNDGGMGLASALGARFLDASGHELPGRGDSLGRVCDIDLTLLDPRISDASFTMMCDVDNPLLGPDGATYTFGPQKGAGTEELRELEGGMTSFSVVLERVFGSSFDVPGAGAAGGLGAACLSFLSASSMSGIERVLELAGFDRVLDGSSLCVTGEGRCDAQTAHGKVVAGVADACRRRGVPCVAVVGGMSADAGSIDGLSAVVPTAIGPMELGEALDRASELYALAADRLFSLVGIGAQGL